MCLDQPQSREEAKMNPPPRSPQVFMEEGNDRVFFWNRVRKGEEHVLRQKSIEQPARFSVLREPKFLKTRMLQEVELARKGSWQDGRYISLAKESVPTP